MEPLSSLLAASSCRPPLISFFPRNFFFSSASTIKPTSSLAPLASSSTASPQRRNPKPKLQNSPPPPDFEPFVAPSVTPNSPLPSKKVLIPIAFGTEEMEAVVLIDVLRRAGADVAVASVEPKLQVEASGGVKLVADMNISECCNHVFDLVVLPGGMPGSARLRDSETLEKITCKQAEEKRLYGAVCAAPAVTLLPWGLLKRKQTTCHPAFHDKLPTFWAVKSKIQVSGELTTSRGPGTTFEFALALVEQLFGETIARDTGESLWMQASDNGPRSEELNKVEWSVDHTPRVLIPVANGFEEIEAVTIVDILRRAKVDVVVASVEKNLQISASHGTKIVADKLIAEASETVYDLIILPGGKVCSERLQKSRILKKLLKEQNLGGSIYGAICSSLTVLHKHGLLKNKRASAHPLVLKSLGLSEEGMGSARVVIDGRVITGRGLASTTDFVLAIVGKLFGHGRARSVAEGLVFEYPRS